MPIQILSGNAVRTKLLSGATQLSDTVTITLGPKGRNVGIDKEFMGPKVLHDGVSVAREIELPDPFENYAAQLIKEAASKTNDRAGDGTTTSTLLAKTIFKLGMKKVNGGVNPMTMKKGIELAVKEVVKILKKDSKEIVGDDMIKQVATISSASTEIGEMITKAVKKVGKEGVITADKDGSITGIELEVKEGMQFDHGYVSPLFVTDQDKMIAESEDPHILITDYVIDNALEIMGFLERFVKETNRREIVIIAPDINGVGLKNLIINKLRGGITPLVVKAPGFGPRQTEMLEDIAVLTGAKVIYRDKVKLEDAPLDMLGKAEKVVSDAETTQIIDGKGDKDKIKKRANLIKDEIVKAKSEFEKTKLEERLSKLVSGAAIIRVGGMTDIELDEKCERVIDAISATKSAMEEGIVAGGGIELFGISEELVDLSDERNDAQAGIDTILEALQAPLAKILDNAGEDVKKVTEKILTEENIENYGFDVETEMFGDMMEMGIIDPTKVTRSAVENAASVAAMLLTTEFVVVPIPEKDDEK